jgi:hypothetical protein
MFRILILFTLIAKISNSYRYLFISINVGYSHLAFDGRLADVLVEKGHQVASFS